MTEFQTRSEKTGLEFFNTIKEALAHAEKDRTVWKISFSVDGEPVRLIRQGNKFIIDQMENHILFLDQPTRCECDPPCEFSKDWPYCSETEHGCPRLKSP